MLDPDIDHTSSLAGGDIPDTADTFWKEVYGIMGVTNGDALEDALKYEKGAAITYSVSSTDSDVTVTVTYADTKKAANSFKVDKAGASTLTATP